MGIPSYFSYIIKNHNKIIQTLQMKVDNLYLDSNSIIYDAYNILRKENISNFETLEKTLIEDTCKKIESYIKLVKPSKRVIVAFDGVAPVAKLEQQRVRRHRTWFIKEINNLYEKNNDSWSTSSITPGTNFMNKLNIFCKSYFKKYNHVMVFGSDEPGEGEHKIFEYIRNNDHNNQNTLVYGLDADLIMLSLNHLPIHKNIYLFRETPDFIRQLDSSLDPNKTYTLNIPMLADAIVNEIHQTKNKDKKIISNRIRDYIFLCFFLGNDFLPHFPALNIRTNGIDILLDVYKNTLSTEDETLTDGNKIVWKNLRKIIQKLGEEEENYIVYENKKRVKRENRYVPNKSTEEKMNKLDLIPSLYREDEIYINTPETGWRERYYKRLFEFNIDESREKQVSINYLEGLEWTFKYYLDTCYDWRWKYNYNYPPLLNDLYKYIPYFETEFIEKKIPQPVNSSTQLIYVLPFNNLDILEKSVYKKISHKLNSWYNNNYNFTWAYCKYFWESHIHLPEIDIDEVEKILTN